MEPITFSTPRYVLPAAVVLLLAFFVLLALPVMAGGGLRNSKDAFSLLMICILGGGPIFLLVALIAGKTLGSITLLSDRLVEQNLFGNQRIFLYEQIVEVRDGIRYGQILLVYRLTSQSGEVKNSRATLLSVENEQKLRQIILERVALQG